MVRKYWPALVAVVIAIAAAAAWMNRTRPARQPEAAAAPVQAASAAPSSRSTAVPAGETVRPVVAYDRYRAELKRIRTEREKAQALQPNERCINGQRFRKVGTAWESAGRC